jgi:heptosyltransferase-2
MSRFGQKGTMSALAAKPLLIVPYQWIGDFVRGHSVVKLLKSQNEGRAIDILATPNAAPLADYMPGVRKAIVAELPRGRLALSKHLELARRLAAEDYGQVLVFPGTFKAALAPYLAGIPRRSGLIGEMRIGLLNDVRYDRARLPRMIDQCASLALPKGAALPPEWPLPELLVPAPERTQWRSRHAPTSGRKVVALAPGAVGPSKRWTAYDALTAALVARGHEVWVVGSPAETAQAQNMQQATRLPDFVRDLTGTDLRNAILALAEADVVVSNDSGLLHVAAALGTASIGIFGPTDPWLWAPLNPLAAIVKLDTRLPCQPCHEPVCRMKHHLCMRDITTEKVLAAVEAALADPNTRITAEAAPLFRRAI